MKRPALKTMFLLLGLVSLITLSSCEKDNPGGGGGGGNPDVSLCTTYGTFTRILCGVSIYDNYWIRTDDGRYLQPCQTDVVNICPLPIQEGTRIRFGYKKISGKTACDDIVTCMAYDQRMAGSTKVRITCMEIVKLQPDTMTCGFKGTIGYDKRCKAKTIMADNVGLLEPVNQDILANYAEGSRVMFGYTQVMTLAVPCTGGGAALIECVRPIMIK